MLKLKLQFFGRLMWRATHWKGPWCWERLKAGGEGDDKDGWMASPARWTWVWGLSFTHMLDQAYTLCLSFLNYKVELSMVITPSELYEWILSVFPRWCIFFFHLFLDLLCLTLLSFYFILEHTVNNAVLNFRCTAKWFSYTCIYSFSNSFPI